MVKQTQAIRRQFVWVSFVDKLFEFDHFVILAIKGLNSTQTLNLNSKPYNSTLRSFNKKFISQKVSSKKDNLFPN